MMLQTKEKQRAMATLNEKNSPFRETHTSKVFKNTANLSLRGNTYDATHMDKFLGSSYCNLNATVKEINHNPLKAQNITNSAAKTTNLLDSRQRSQTIAASKSKSNNGNTNTLNKTDLSTQAKSLLKSYMNTTNTIRPSVAFTSQNRDQVPRVLTYVDLYDGPSSLQQRDGVVTQNEKLQGQGQGNIYENERQQHLENLNQSIQELKQAQDSLMSGTDSAGLLKSPQQRREENETIKQKLSMYNEVKQQQMFIGKRDRLIKAGWRHGIVGVENAGLSGDQTQSVFYQDLTKEKQREQDQKDAINRRRQKRLALGMGTSALINFGVSDELKRATSLFKTPEKSVDILDQWKSKGRSPTNNQNRLNTFDRMFKPLDVKNGDAGDPKGEGGDAVKVRLERTIKLRNEEQRGKQYNIVNGLSATNDEWLHAYGAGKSNNKNGDMKNHWKQQLQL